MTWSSTGCRGWSSGPGRSGTRAPRPPPPPRPSPCPPPRSGWHNLQHNTKYKFVSGEIYFLFLLALSWIPDAGQWNDDNMIFYYLIFESYLHISHLIFDIIHPSLPHWDRRRRAVYGKNRFDNSILIHYILLHALSLLLRSELVLKVRWLLGFQGGVFIWPGESPMLYQVTHAAICTLHTLASPLSVFLRSRIHRHRLKSFFRHNFPPRRGLGADIRRFGHLGFGWHSEPIGKS